MKKAMLLAVLVVACGRSEQATTDTPAMAVGPAPITAADIAGTWTGMSMGETGDSVLIRWTLINPEGTVAKGVFEGSTDTLTVTHTFDADSFVATTSPYADQMAPGKPQVITRAVGRLISAGKTAGTATTMLVSKPDSIVSRGRWEATKSP
ncbi:MAG: hypothetical protein ACT4P6_23120 [Gemmatimonadaceae bacterium]